MSVSMTLFSFWERVLYRAHCPYMWWRMTLSFDPLASISSMLVLQVYTTTPDLYCAGDQTRDLGFMYNKQALYQLSYIPSPWYFHTCVVLYTAYSLPHMTHQSSDRQQSSVREENHSRAIAQALELLSRPFPWHQDCLRNLNLTLIQDS